MAKTTAKLEALRDEKNQLKRQLASTLDDKERFAKRYRGTEDAMQLFTKRADELRERLAEVEDAIKAELRIAYS